MFMVDKDYQIRQRTSQFWSAQIITQEWAEPKDALHHQYLASSDVKDAAGHTLVTAYALERPDHQWSLMLINKDYDNPHQVRIVFANGPQQQEHTFAGKVSVISFGKQQYRWHSARKNGYADPDNPPVKTSVNSTAATVYTLPAASLTVLRGKLN
jgi:hypothetical protein